VISLRLADLYHAIPLDAIAPNVVRFGHSLPT